MQGIPHIMPGLNEADNSLYQNHLCTELAILLILYQNRTKRTVRSDHGIILLIEGQSHDLQVGKRDRGGVK